MNRNRTLGKLLLIPAAFLLTFTQLFYTLSLSAFNGQLHLNELVALNEDGLTDEDGDRTDWIELYNSGPGEVNLQGWYLTDDPHNLTKWQVQHPITLTNNSYFLVFASGKNRQGAELHTSFSLSSDGEYLALVQPDGLTIASEITSTFPTQYPNLSYGLPVGQTDYAFFDTPTPGAENNTPFYEGVVEPIQFSHERGFYETGFTLVLTTSPGATIRYTTDGSTPTAGHGSLYSAPLAINQTSLIRAVAYATNQLTTTVDTHTYLFLNDVVTQYANGNPPPGWPADRAINNQAMNYGMDPDITGRYTTQQMKDAFSSISTISLVTDLSNLLDPATGIYVNATQRGQAWERPTSVELLSPDGSETGFQINAGLRIRGGYSRNAGNPKHAFRLFFRDEYGADELEYPFFGTEGADEFKNLDLRTEQNYSWSFGNDGRNTFLREVFARDLMREMGEPYTRSRYHHLYINGVYWGIYMSEERPEADFGETYLGGDDDNYDTIKSGGSSQGYNTEATDGTMTGPWQTLWNYTRAQFSSPQLNSYMQMQGLNPDGTRNPSYPIYLNAHNLIDYMIATFYVGNFDGPLSTFVGASNNWYAIKDSSNPDQGFVYLMHDSEHSLGTDMTTANRVNRVGPYNTDQQHLFNRSNPQFLHQDLALTAEYRINFADQVHLYFFNNGLLTPAGAAALMDTRRVTVDQFIIAEAARWGDSKKSSTQAPFDKPNWLTEVNKIYNNYFPIRTNQVLNQLRSAGLYPSVVAPTYNQHGGLVDYNFGLVMTAPAGTIYYTLDGSDPRLVGGALNPAALTYSGSVPLTQDGPVKARVLSSGTWSALNQATFIIDDFVPAAADNLLLTELNYNPTDGGQYEFLELKNISAQRVDLGNVTISGGITFTFPANTLLNPGAHLLIVDTPADFTARYATVGSPWYFVGLSYLPTAWTGDLSNGGEMLTITAADSSPILQLSYDDEGTWPGRADGFGSALELIDPAAVPLTQPEKNAYLNDGNNWRSTSEYHGSPGRDGAGPDNSIVVNEILANSEAPHSDQIEFYNTSGQPIDLSFWYLSDNKSNYKKFRIYDPTVLSIGQLVSFSEADFNNAANPNNPFPFALGSGGETIYLLEADAAGNLLKFVHHIDFPATRTNQSIGYLPDGEGNLVRLCQMSFGESNNLPGNFCHGPVVINEIQYNPAGVDSNLEFIELYNFGSTTENLAGWKFRGDVHFDFLSGSLAPQQALLLVGFNPSNSTLATAFRTAYGLEPTVILVGPWTAAAELNDDGGYLKLSRTDNTLEDEVTYDDEAPWVTAPDGHGPSLELIDPALDNRQASSWEASLAPTGTPGRHNNDDNPLVHLPTELTVMEGDTAVITVTLAHASGLTVTVELQTAAGTATAGADYTPITPTLTFTPGQTSQIVYLQTTADPADEPDETLTLHLNQVSHGRGGASPATITIADDDEPATVSIQTVMAVTEGDSSPVSVGAAVSLDPASGFTVTVPFTISEQTATAGVDYTATSSTLTFAPGETIHMIPMLINPDLVYEGDETFVITLGTPTLAILGNAQQVITITDNESEPTLLQPADQLVQEGAEGEMVTVTLPLTLSHPSAFTTTVAYETAAGSATAGEDYQTTSGTVTFAPLQTSQNIMVTVLGDNLDEPNEQFAVMVEGVTTTITIADDDGASQLSVSSISLAEGDSGLSTAVVEVYLLPASGQEVTVHFATQAGSATAGEDYQTAGGTLTFAPGQITQTITISVSGDTLFEADEWFFVGLSEAVNAEIDQTTGEINITNDDVAPAVSLSPAVTITEGNSGVQAVTFTVSLSAVSGVTATVQFTTTDGTATAGEDYQATSGTLIFAPGEVSKTVVVLVVGDETAEEDELLTLVLGSFENVTAGGVTSSSVTILNDDSPAPTGIAVYLPLILRP